MQIPLNITIPFPCHENWNAMTPETQGRHCKACDKVVVDFTTMSDDEILIFLQKTKENICGRMTNHQLTEHPTLNKKLKLFLYALASVFLLSMNVEAQTDSIKNSTSINLGGDRTSGNYAVDGMIIMSDKKTVAGVVVDEKGNPLNFATVAIFSNYKLIKGQRTNDKGEFSFKDIPNDKYILRINYTGYKKYETLLDLENYFTHQLKITLEKNKPNNNGVIIKPYHSIGIISADGPIRRVDTLATQEYLIEGIVQDEKGNPLDFATVTISQNGIVIAGKKTDMNGMFKTSINTFGKSIIRVTYSGLITEELIININQDVEIGKLTFKLKKNNNINFGQIYRHGKINIINPQNPNQKIINKEDMKHMGYR